MPSVGLSLSPEFRLAQPLPVSIKALRAAQTLADTVLENTFELVEQQFTYGDIPFWPDATLTGFQKAIPGTEVASYDLTRIPATRYAASQIIIHLRDSNDSERQIHLTELQPRGRVLGDFTIYDSAVHRGSRSASSIERDVVYKLLELQLWAPDDPPRTANMGMQELCQHLGSRAQAYRRERRVGATRLLGLPIFHAERSIMYDPTDIADTPIISTYSTWLTGSVEESQIAGVRNLRVRTRADFNGNNLGDPENGMSYEVTADEMNDESARLLADRYRLSRSKGSKIVRVFTNCTVDYNKMLHAPNAPKS